MGTRPPESPVTRSTGLPRAEGPLPETERRWPSGSTVSWAALLAAIVVAVSVVVAALVLSARDEQRARDERGRVVVFDPQLTRPETELLSHVPLVQRVSGSRVVWRRGARCGRAELSGGAVASFACDLRDAGAEGIRYTAYPSVEDLTAVYEREREAAGVERWQGSCKAGPPAEHNWQSSYSGAVGSVLPDGRVLCIERDGVGTIVWTREDVRTLSETWSSGDWAALHRFWSTEAGPLE